MKVFNYFKSVMSPRPCIMITFLFFIMKILCKESEEVFNSKHTKILDDLPTTKDLDVYLTKLEKLVNFCIKHKKYVDLNMEFGLFLISVNLSPALDEKRQNIPMKVRYRLEQLIMKNDVVANYFYHMVDKLTDKKFERDADISRMFSNVSTWPRHVIKFNTVLLKQTKIYSAEQLEKIYGKWENYETNVYDFTQYKPSPEESDDCIQYLARKKYVNDKRAPGNCETPPHCKQGIKVGSEFGYGLTHRLLFLIIARFARGCTVFSLKEDKYKADKYCMRSFNEAQFIAANDYQLADLMMEQMTLCGLYGHAQFFRNSWLKNLLDYQTSEGCFTDERGSNTYTDSVMTEGANDKWKIATQDKIMGGGCRAHITAVASGTLASTLRYVLEKYY